MPPIIPEITERKVVIVEGDDEVRIFVALIRHLSLDGIQFVSSDGIDGIRRTIQLAVQAAPPGMLDTLGVARDADANSNRAFQSVSNSLVAAGLSAPLNPLEIAEGTDGNPNAIVLILPHGQSTGALEDVCLASVSNDPMMPCVNEFISCVDDRIDAPALSPGNRAKAQAQAYLASRRRPGRRLREAVNEWDFDHSSFEPMKRFLGML